MTDLSAAINRVKPSPTVALTGRVAELRASGREIIGLGAGEPDFPTPEHISDAAIAAIRDGKTRYTAPDGIRELKEAIVGKFERENNIRYTPDHVIVSTGGKQVIFNALLATLDPGDEVLIPAPYWVSYPDIVRLAGATPVILETTAKTGFKLSADQLSGAITERTKWIILNSPSNPTGAAYTHSELAALLDVVAPFPALHVMADDIYEHLVYDGFKFATPAAVRPELADRTLIINGVSKAYAMTGWRIGYGAGPVPLIAAMRKLQGQSTSNACSIAQWAAVSALDGPQDFLKTRADAFRVRRDMVVDGLTEIDGIECSRPDGAFYVFPNIEKLLGRKTSDGHVLADDLSFAEALLDTNGVALVPGTAFGAPGHVRISYAASDADLSRAISLISSFAASLN